MVATVRHQLSTVTAGRALLYLRCFQVLYMGGYRTDVCTILCLGTWLYLDCHLHESVCPAISSYWTIVLGLQAGLPAPMLCCFAALEIRCPMFGKRAGAASSSSAQPADKRPRPGELLADFDDYLRTQLAAQPSITAPALLKLFLEEHPGQNCGIDAMRRWLRDARQGLDQETILKYYGQWLSQRYSQDPSISCFFLKTSSK